jgi:hypothetical protein
MAQRCYIGNWKSAESVDSAEEIRMIENAGGILLALELIVFSLVSHWLVWTLDGLGKEPRTAEEHGTRARDRTGRGF